MNEDSRAVRQAETVASERLASSPGLDYTMLENDRTRPPSKPPLWPQSGRNYHIIPAVRARFTRCFEHDLRANPLLRVFTVKNAVCDESSATTYGVFAFDFFYYASPEWSCSNCRGLDGAQLDAQRSWRFPQIPVIILAPGDHAWTGRQLRGWRARFAPIGKVSNVGLFSI